MKHQDREYRRAARAVLAACRELRQELALSDDPDLVTHPLAQASVSLVPGDSRTCCGVVRAFASSAPITLVVGRAVHGPLEGSLEPGEPGVELRQTRIAGRRVIKLLAQAWWAYEEFLRSCPCGHDLQALHQVCPACRTRPQKGG